MTTRKPLTNNQGAPEPPADNQGFPGPLTGNQGAPGPLTDAQKSRARGPLIQIFCNLYAKSVRNLKSFVLKAATPGPRLTLL